MLKMARCVARRHSSGRAHFGGVWGVYCVAGVFPTEHKQDYIFWTHKIIYHEDIFHLMVSATIIYLSRTQELIVELIINNLYVVQPNQMEDGGLNSQKAEPKRKRCLELSPL